MRDFIRNYNYLFQWLAGLGIPLALVVSSWIITTSMEQTKLDSEYVKIALSILTSKHHTSGTEDTNSDPSFHNELALRHWAIRLLNKKSPEKFTDEEQQALLEGENYLVRLDNSVDQAYAVIADAIREPRSKK